MKYLPVGTQVSLGSVAIGGLIGVGIPSRTRGAAESTDTDSGGDREYIAGLREGGEVTLTFRHDPDDAGQQKLESNYDAASGAATEECVITLPPESGQSSIPRTYTFDAFVISAPQGDLGLTEDTVAEQTATLKVAGAVSIAP